MVICTFNIELALRDILQKKQFLSVCTNLQWTTMGPASGGLQDLTRRRKDRMGVGYSGTPWSGQAMNWNCLTSLFSLEPFCRRASEAERL